MELPRSQSKHFIKISLIEVYTSIHRIIAVPKKALSQGYLYEIEQYKGHILKSHLTKPFTKNFYLWLFLITLD